MRRARPAYMVLTVAHAGVVVPHLEPATAPTVHVTDYSEAETAHVVPVQPAPAESHMASAAIPADAAKAHAEAATTYVYP